MEIQKYKRYAGVWDRIKSFLVGFLMWGVAAYILQYVINDFKIHIMSFIDIIFFIPLLILDSIEKGNIIFLILLSIALYISLNFSNDIFKISIINEKTGKKIYYKKLLKYWWYKFIFLFLLPTIVVIITATMLFNESGFSWLIVLLLGSIIVILFWILMSLINFIELHKDPKKQSWYEKKAGVLLVVRD